MSNDSDWLPPLIKMEHANNVWADYCEMVYQAFTIDFVASRPQFEKMPVRCKQQPFSQGKEAGFWHCVSSGKTEKERVPDCCRCERIRWARSIIEHRGDNRVKNWSTDARGDMRCYLWFNDEYLIALGKRNGHYQLITAFCTTFEHNRRKLQKEYEACRNN